MLLSNFHTHHTVQLHTIQSNYTVVVDIWERIKARSNSVLPLSSKKNITLAQNVICAYKNYSALKSEVSEEQREKIIHQE